MTDSAATSPQPQSEPPSPGGATTLLEVRSVTKRFGPHEVLKSLSLDIAAGEFLTLLGESGSGKTTLLRLIAGFEQPTTGEIRMNNERLDTQPAHKRQVNTVFQHYALFPHLSVRENVAYGLKVKSTPQDEIAPRVDQALAMVKMTDFANARPTKLSGGQQQRISLARALINRPQLLLLDEPLSALDANLRKQMQSELKSLQREIGITFLFVTHDQEEAMALSDRIALLRNGALEQIAAPREIYANPATAYTAQFIGQTNLLHAEIRNGIATCGPLRWPADGTGDVAEGESVYSLRPESIQLAAEADDAAPSSAKLVRFRATIRQQIYAGPTELLELDWPGPRPLRARIASRGPLTGEHEFAFAASDAIQVKE